MEAGRCLVVIEAVEAMAEGAANALLKTLEEPGDGLLILLSAAPDRLLSTIRSRCQAIPFARLANEPLQQVLAAQPAPTQPDPPELLELAAGSPGAVLEHRQQWQALPEGLAQRCAELISPTPQAVSPVAALSLARDLCDALEVEQQLWLLDWWQCACGATAVIPGSNNGWKPCGVSCALMCSPAWPGKWRCLSSAVQLGPRPHCGGFRARRAPAGPVLLRALRWAAPGNSPRHTPF